MDPALIGALCSGAGLLIGVLATKALPAWSNYRRVGAEMSATAAASDDARILKGYEALVGRMGIDIESLKVDVKEVRATAEAKYDSLRKEHEHCLQTQAAQEREIAYLKEDQAYMRQRLAKLENDSKS